MTPEEAPSPSGDGLDGPRLPEGLDTAPHLLVALDYDGTLAPFHEDPARAVPLPGVLPIVHALARLPRVSVAIVSGRPVAELERFVTPQDAPSAPLLLVGEHGWERRDGPRQRRKAMSASLEERLERAFRTALDAGAGALLERKRAALVLHLRGIGPEGAHEAAELARACVDSWTHIAEEPGDPADTLRLEWIDGGIELRAGAHDKGSVLRELLDTMPPGTVTVYAGDDRTDEDAFRVLTAHSGHGAPPGLAVRIAREPRPTAAHATVPSCEALRDWLERLLHHLNARNLEDDTA
jgi:trehalose 6-phosphate phosphatase